MTPDDGETSSHVGPLRTEYVIGPGACSPQHGWAQGWLGQKHAITINTHWATLKLKSGHARVRSVLPPTNYYDVPHHLHTTTTTTHELLLLLYSTCLCACTVSTYHHHYYYYSTLHVFVHGIYLPPLLLLLLYSTCLCACKVSPYHHYYSTLRLAVCMYGIALPPLLLYSTLRLAVCMYGIIDALLLTTSHCLNSPAPQCMRA